MSDLDDQKYLLFFVPNYDATNAADGSGSPLTYVKLGSSKSSDSLSTAEKRGDDLLEAAGLSTDASSTFFVDDARGVDCDDAAANESSPYVEEIHVDGHHERADCLDVAVTDAGTIVYRSKEKGVYTADATKTDLSAELLGEETSSTDPRGGWRDHTDGNRVVTVRGDRVDVVVGNYKRVVFGRVSGDHVGAASYEASGGHLFERSSTGAVELYAIEHVEETAVDGSTRWKIVERAHEADHVERWSGTLREHHNGPARKTTIGIDEEDATKNPEITISRNIGTLDATLVATSVDRRVQADTIEERTEGGKLGETVVCDAYEKARGSWSERGYSFKEELWCNVAIDADAFVASFDLTLGGAFFDDEISELAVQAGVRLDAHVGPRFEFHYGTDTRIQFAPVIKETVGVALDVDVGLYGHASLFYWSYVPVEGRAHVGHLEVEYLRKEDGVADSRAFALLAHL